MILIPSEKLRSLLYLSICLLSLPLLTECDKIRLVGPSRCSGRVEIYHRDSWGTVCDDQWSIVSAEVVCRELDCGTVLEAKKNAFFGEGKNEIWLDDVQCTGQEASILKCSHRPIGENNCGHGEDAGVICSDHVKTVNGSNRCNGKVEVYHDGRWNRVCNTDWNMQQAEVLCREINCGTPLPQAEVPPLGEQNIFGGLKTSCFGNESSVSECSLQDIKENCVDATTFCTHSKPIRLMNGTNRCNGRVELYHDGQWGTVCDDRWGMQEAAVACREMNCGNALSVRYKAFYGTGTDQVWLDDVECTGYEKSLGDCPHRGFGQHDCDHSEDAGVECSETVRLTNGTNACSGKLEVYYNGHWGKMCSNYWSQEEAAVVCKEISCGAPKKDQQTFHFGESRLGGLTARCSGNVSSITQCGIREFTGRCDGVSLACEGSPQLRLVNGTDRCSGRVEVLHDGQWGTVCDDEWDIRDAQVVCRAMDCGTAQTAKSGAFFGQGQGGIWLDDVGCVGNETSLLHCRHPTLGENNCGHAEDAGVVCSATIRLINGTNQCSGRVELHDGVRWSPAFYINWGMSEAEVVCRMMDCGDPVKVSGSFGRGKETRGYKITCNGRESSLSQCNMRAYVRTSSDRVEEAGVECSGNVRLAGGNNHCVGRVEYYNKGQWGTVCGEAWDISDATVVCRQLDCGRAHKISTTDERSRDTGQTWIDRIECNGMESTLTQCRQSPFRDRTCNISSVAGVICTGGMEVRLANGKDECSGRVEVRHGEEWYTVCDTEWSHSKAGVVCAQLECGEPVSAPVGAQFGQGNGSVVEASDSCFRNVSDLQQCSLRGFSSSTCGHEKDVGAVCAAQLRLVGGSGPCSGRVEVHYKGEWGTVCDDEWELPNADVVCKQLGCGHAVSAPTSAHFGRGSGPIWLDNVRCSGDESALTQCEHPDFGENNCGHGEDAGVVCIGALNKPQLTLSPGPVVNWGERVEITCTVLTEHLGGTFILKRLPGTFKMEKYSENEAATFVFPTVDFTEKGSYFCEYQKRLPNQVINYPQGNIAELSVTVKLETPSISLSSPHSMVIYSPDKISVKEGSAFSITCSTHSRYPGGYFYLTRSNESTTDAKPAFGHSIFYLAYFEFPAIDSKHQGDYTCVYGVNISSKPFCSVPSKTLQVTITAASSSSIVTGVVVGLMLVLIVVVLGYFLWRRRWRVTDTLVQFSNRFGGALKQDADDRVNGAYDGRTRNIQVNEQALSPVPEEKTAEVENSVERAPEDLAGRVCYELEPLVFP
ncbi:scavenger receptor cysteine-rich type 1 protein M130-like [Xyrichtys novacula]|uniref:Soluble scavenger receptor cysteine-rich domain-containing protein SSC5D n=2 Tax=Xyrichtys novacula TaxID=13765 RepID=A0AAV1GWK3_XYRNO|nr:scavenger receptor cysteine-rich type 1 protein M130-like [Xyrichtys novacula]